MTTGSKTPPERREPDRLADPPRPDLSEAERAHLDAELDEALEETFPASDPPALLRPHGPPAPTA